MVQPSAKRKICNVTLVLSSRIVNSILLEFQESVSGSLIFTEPYLCIASPLPLVTFKTWFLFEDLPSLTALVSTDQRYEAPASNSKLLIKKTFFWSVLCPNLFPSASATFHTDLFHPWNFNPFHFVSSVSTGWLSKFSLYTTYWADKWTTKSKAVKIKYDLIYINFDSLFAI